MTASEKVARPRRTQEKRRLETRAKLVNATIKLLYEKGAVGLTMEEVARDAGLTRGAIQYNFDSPKSLLIDSIIEIANRLSQHLDVVQLLKLPLEQRIDRVVDDYWQGFGGENYSAFIEIAVRGRQDEEFSEAITSTLAAVEQERMVVWRQVFADSGRSDSEIASWRSILLITLRGLALTKMIAGGIDKNNAEINQFKDMFRKYLTGN